MTEEAADEDSPPFVIEGLAELRGYTQQPPMSLDEMFAFLESLKQRLIVPSARVEEFEAAVRAAGLGHAVMVVGHPWLKPDQVFLAASEAELQQSFMDAAQADLRATARCWFGHAPGDV